MIFSKKIENIDLIHKIDQINDLIHTQLRVYELIMAALRSRCGHHIYGRPM